jgi:hypothetical protein
MVATASAIHSPANQERGRAAPRAAIDATRSTGEIRSEPVENRKPSTGRAPMKKEPFTDRRNRSSAAKQQHLFMLGATQHDE